MLFCLASGTLSQNAGVTERTVLKHGHQGTVEREARTNLLLTWQGRDALPALLVQ